MEKRIINCIPLAKTNDEVFKITYLTMLTENSVESIKLPTNFNNYKYSHLIRPDYLLNLEIIKTRKNWILKNILKFQQINQPACYNDFLKQSEISKIILKHLHMEQETNILSFLIKTFQANPINELDIKEFEQNLTKSLGFI
ncbi:MAG: hypothetical protein HC932_01680 [Thermales bacterium]|nr:hypothetical protein [Thermales bacterium]